MDALDRSPHGDARGIQPEEAPQQASLAARGPRKTRAYVLSAAALAGLVVIGLITRGWWLPSVRDVAGAFRPDSSKRAGAEELAPVDQHAGQDDATSLELSEQAQKNIGLRLATVKPRDFDRTISVPATIVERPGWSQLMVSAPMTGIVTRIYPIRGEAVQPGEPLFDLRLTHEDLVEKQTALLRALEELDVVRRQVARLEKVTAEGAIAGKQLLERVYEQQKTEAAIRAQRQALALHGLSEAQIEGIYTNRRLLQELTITAPRPTDCELCADHGEFLQVTELAVKRGEHVTAGRRLAILSDHCELYVEGKAFEQDAETLNRAADLGVAVTAVVEGNGSGSLEARGLRILYVENEIEMSSRALRFYVRLPNELVRNEKTPDGHRFIGWRYKPGQRVEVLLPVQQWKNKIVLPVEAVVQEGVESYVYQQIAGRFDRKPVHVEYRDQRWAVLESDGTLFPGDVVAARGAYLIHLALKNMVGGGPDPHAGHQH